MAPKPKSKSGKANSDSNNKTNARTASEADLSPRQVDVRALFQQDCKKQKLPNKDTAFSLRSLPSHVLRGSPQDATKSEKKFDTLMVVVHVSMSKAADYHFVQVLTFEGVQTPGSLYFFATSVQSTKLILAAANSELADTLNQACVHAVAVKADGAAKARVSDPRFKLFPGMFPVVKDMMTVAWNLLQGTKLETTDLVVVAQPEQFVTGHFPITSRFNANLKVLALGDWSENANRGRGEAVILVQSEKGSDYIVHCQDKSIYTLLEDGMKVFITNLDPRPYAYRPPEDEPRENDITGPRLIIWEPRGDLDFKSSTVTEGWIVQDVANP